MQKVRLLLTCFMFLAMPCLRAQVLYCPPNIDFENNSFTNWYLYTGSCCPITTNNYNANPVNNRHVLTSGTGTDPYGGFPVVSPFGGNYSLKLGNNSVNAQAERARYYINVPNNLANYSLIFRYAVVFENPNHTVAQQPRFEVKAYDSATNALIPCINFSFVASTNLPGFTLSSSGTQVWYKEWSTASLDLSGLGGKTIAIDFASGDCSVGLHFGYGYVDMNCGLFQVSGKVCKGTTSSQISAPFGFAQYRWYDSSFTTLIDTLQTISVPTPADSNKYKVILIPYPGFGCPDTLESTIYVSDVAVSLNPDTTVCLGKSMQLKDTVTGSSRFFPVAYSWTTGPNLSCTNCLNPIASPTAPSNKYVLRVTDAIGCVIRDSLTIAVRQQRIDNQPQNILQCRGTKAVFKVVAGGTGPFFYQWKKNGVNIFGETKDSLVLNTIGYTDTANYTVVVSGDCDTITSNAAKLSVHKTPIITLQPVDKLQCPGTRVLFKTSATNGALNYGWKKNGAMMSSQTKDSLVLNNIGYPDTASYTMFVGGQCDTVYSDTVDLDLKPLTSISIQPQTTSQCLGDNALFRVAASGSGTLSYQWKKNGTNIPGATNDTLILTNITYTDSGSYAVMVKSECDSLLSSSSVKLNINIPGNISTQPATLTQCKGSKAVFRVTATGTGTLRYQWKKNGTNIPGATKDSLVLNNITYADTASYVVDVMSDCDTLNSSISAGKLNIYQTPVITLQPLHKLQCPGTRVVFKTIATNGALNYGWKKNGTTIGSQTKDSLVLNSIGFIDTASYTMFVGGQCDTVYSDTVDLDLKPLTSISIQPQTNSQCLGDNALFRVAASGSGTLSFQWKKNGTNIPGATNDTLILTNISYTDSGSYAVMVKSECDSLQSASSVKLNINIPGSISMQPVTLTQCKGSRAVFRVTATGTGTLRYQWKKNGVNISGANKDSLVLNNITYADTASYVVDVMSDCDTLTSNVSAGKLNIHPTPIITLQPLDKLQCPGTRVVFKTSATNGALNYGWKKNNISLVGQTKDSLVLNSISFSDTASYTMFVGGQCDTVYSDTVDLDLKPLTSISIQPQTTSQCLGDNALFRVAASGSGTLSFQWKKNGTNIPGATNDTLILANISYTDSGSYAVMVKSECDSLLSSSSVKLNINIPGSISMQPVTLTQCKGSKAVFRVTATGTGTLRYQWKKNGTNIPGATKDSLVLNNITYADTAGYVVDVMSDCDTLTSSNSAGKLNIHQTPVITLQPLDKLQCPGTRVVFKTSATNGALNYGWKKNGINIGSQTKDSLVLNSISFSDTASYTMFVGGQCDTVYSDTVDLDLKPLTSITIQPQTTSQCLGDNALFRVAATGSGTLSYQWKKNGTNIPGATNDTLILTNISYTDSGSYAVMVKSECDSLQSASSVKLNINTPGSISTQPVALTQCKGSKAVFRVTATGTGTLRYQWKKNGVNIPGATKDSLVLNNITYADTARYVVDVMSDCDTLTSSASVGKLNIYQTPVITLQPVDELQCPGTRVVFKTSATNGALNYGWKKNGVTMSGQSKDSLVLNSIGYSDTASYTMFVGGQCDTVYSDTVDLDLKPLTSISIQPQTTSQCLGDNALFLVAASGSGTLSYQWKKNGTNIPGATNDTLILTNISYTDSGSYAVMVKSECDSLQSASSVKLNINTPGSISTQPVALTQCKGSKAVFRVTATGTGTLRYQWKKNGVNIPGATKDSLVLNNITYGDTARYVVDVMSDCDTLTSSTSAGKLNIHPTPVITLQPVDKLQCPGTRVVFKTSATNGALNYGWKKNGATMSGQTKDSLVLNNIGYSDTASYTMFVGGQCDTVYSDTVDLDLKLLTSIVVSPQINNQCAGNTALFSVKANGSGTFSYQWKKSGVNILGATNDTLLIPNMAASDTGSYSVSVKSECDSILSGNAQLNLNPATLVNTQPQSLTRCRGTKAVFKVTGSGTGPVTYQWRKNGSNILGATKDSLELNNINYTDTAAYTVQVMAECDTIGSNIAYLKIPPVPVMLIQPQDVLQCPGTRGLFKAQANDALNYTWKKNNITIAGANSDSLVIPSIAVGDTAYYFVAAGGACDTIYSDTVELDLKPLTKISIQPQTTGQCLGDQALFRVVASGSGVLNYQWKKNGTNIPGATNDTLILTNINYTDSGSYAVLVKSECDSLLSSSSVKLNINSPGNIGIQPATITQCKGSRAVFRSTATGTGTLRYQWKKNGVAIPGETKDSLVLNNIAHADTATYAVLVMSDCDTLTSNASVGKLNIYQTPIITLQPVDKLQCPGTRVVFKTSATNGALNYGWKKNGATISGQTKDSLVLNSIGFIDTASYTMFVGGQCDTVYSDTVDLDLKLLTSIVVSPQINNQCAGNTALFSVKANGSGTFSYQWKKSGVNITGATNDTLLIANMAAADTGSYSVSVKSECDSILSGNALLHLNPATSVNAQPQSVMQCKGTRAVFRVTASGTGMLYYQWRKNGVALSGETKDSLVLPNIAYSDTADYTVVVSADCDTVISAMAQLSIHPKPVITLQPLDKLQCPATRVVFKASATNGAINYSWKKNGVTMSGQTKDSLILNNIGYSDTASYTMFVSGQCDTLYSDTVDLDLKLLTSIVVSPQVNNQCAGNTALFSVKANGSGTFSYQWKKSGVNILGATNDTLLIANMATSDTGAYSVSVKSECDSVLSANAQLNLNPATLVNTQPQSLTQCKGTKAVLRVTSSGTGAITYQWRKNGTNISGATKDSLVLNTINYTDTAAYTVQVMAECDTVISAIARIGIHPTPVIVLQPLSKLQCPGTRVVFKASATNGVLNYGWKKNGVNITGEAKDSLVRNNITYPDTALYSMFAGGQCDTVYSDTVKLAMKLFTGVVITPLLDSQCLGGNALFRVLPAGSGTTFSYQWRKNGVNLPGATNDTLLLNNLALNDFTNYSVLVKSECDSMLSPLAVLDRKPPVQIVTNPVAGRQCKGTRAVFRVKATGHGTLKYQWKKNGTNIAGAITDSLVINTIGFADTAGYTVLVKGTCDSVLSAMAHLRLFPQPQPGLPDSVSLCEDQAVLKADPGFVSYLWSTGATTDTAQVAAGGEYWVRVVDANNCVNKDTARVRIRLLPTVEAGSDTLLCNEAVLNLYAKAREQASVAWLPVNTGAFSDSSVLNTLFSPASGTTGNVSLVITVNNTCGSDTDEVIINLMPKVLARFDSDTVLCERSAAVVLNPSEPGGKFSGPYVSGSTFNPAKAGTYEIKYKISRNGCVDSSMQKIRVIPVPEASFKVMPRIPTVDKEVEFTSTSKNAASQLWRFHNGDTSTRPVAYHYYAEEGRYWIELVAINEICRDSIQQEILIEGSEKIWAPNVFTPNGDGVNDVFRLRYRNSRGATMLIYNRWGEEIFRTDNINEGWDGTYRNQVCQDDAYVWIVLYRNLNGIPLEESGTVTLLR